MPGSHGYASPRMNILLGIDGDSDSVQYFSSQDLFWEIKNHISLEIPLRPVQYIGFMDEFISFRAFMAGRSFLDFGNMGMQY